MSNEQNTTRDDAEQVGRCFTADINPNDTDDHDWEHGEDVVGGTYIDRWMKCLICGEVRQAEEHEMPTGDDD